MAKPKSDKVKPRKKAVRKAAASKAAKAATAPPEPAATQQAVESPAARIAEFQFKPGQSGNPAGRQKGSRNKFGEQFMQDFLDDWTEHGRTAIATVRQERPQDYLKAAVAILPKQFEVRIPLEEMSEEQLNDRIRHLAGILEIGAGAASRGKEAPQGSKPASSVQSVH